jgi:hypothetical protein
MRAGVEVSQTWGQLRRWTCSKCQGDFVYLARGSVKAEAKGVPYLSLVGVGGELIEEAAMERARGKLRQIEGSKRAGRAACPSCGHVAFWMRFPRYSITWALYGLVLGFAAVAIGFSALVPEGLDPRFKNLLAYASLLLGPLGGATLGHWLALRACPLDRKALAWSDFESFRAEARSRGVGLEDAWLERLGQHQGVEALSPRLAPGCKFE